MIMKKILKFLGIIVVFFLILNFALEPIAKRYVNNALGDLDGYIGSVEDIDIALWRGAYVIQGLDIEKIESDVRVPFFATEAMDISLEWIALFQGAIVGEVVLTAPTLNFSVEPSSGEIQDGGDNDWVEVVQGLVPIQINRCEVVNGEIHYIDETVDPSVDLKIQDVTGVATNLNNASRSSELLPSNIDVNGKMMGTGTMSLEMDINPLMAIPDFDITLKFEDAELTTLNDFTKAYAGFTFDSGQLFISSEVAMKDSTYTGYVKPILAEAQVLGGPQEDKTIWRKVWTVAAAGLIKAFENQQTGEFATKVPFSGDMTDSDVSVLATIANVLQNAFIEAYTKDVDGTIDITDVNKVNDKGFFKELFDDDGGNGN